MEINNNVIYVLALAGFAFLGKLMIEIQYLFVNTEVLGKREVREQLSLGDPQEVKYWIKNTTGKTFMFMLKDYLPFQIQMVGFLHRGKLRANELLELKTIVTPMERGEYIFDALEIFLSTPFSFVERKMILVAEKEKAKVYPSQIQMSKYSLANVKNTQKYYGVKKVRRVGHSYEFDHIKSYVMGDDVRSINWKATSRRNELMVNHYEDEKSQAIYCVVDKSRTMNMPFNGMSLVDYAVNASLVICNNALQYQDRAGLITFSNVLGNVVPAAKSIKQLGVINEALYHQKYRNTEANYELLHYSIKKLTRKRGLFFLFSNFENMNALKRQLPIILRIAKQNLLVMVIFENYEVEEFTQRDHGRHLYENAVAHKYLYEKELMVKKLRSYGVRCIYTRPEDLTINTLNEYLYLKSTGRI